ncbi:MAG TPA: bifunctional phosphoribosylaminoimidazolecarboxamide formyltransferase/IMP cyclohydrolase [Nitrososphaerales archaeon]|nr:bifunctional phosphoribosylaminoimidazolecarboxamide formyltransferase/IMP cyclohydrolase [Nitrososphaerales archaeon]
MQDSEVTSKDNLEIKTALVSTFDKTGLVEFARTLKEKGVSLIATGGTLAALRDSGFDATPLDKIARFPEMLDGRVKTLQPEIFAGILARKNKSDHMSQIEEKGISPIDMVVCNFYAFEETAQRDSVEDELIEMIDIGGPSIVRAAAKNFESTCVVPSPEFYDRVSMELESKKGISIATRRALATAAFGIVASYDISIYNALSERFYPERGFPESYFLSAKRFEEPKYGENPGQGAMIYSLSNTAGGIREWKQLFGDVRSYNNYLDIASAFDILEGFEDSPAAATVKHGQISGFGLSSSLSDAYRLAHGCDPDADFGNTTVLNRNVDVETAKLVGRNEGAKDDSVYTEILVAPSYDTEALEILKLKQKKKMRIIQAGRKSSYPYDVRVMQGLVLVQDSADYRKKLSSSSISIESAARPTGKDFTILLGLWEVARRVESNGIVIGNGEVDPDGTLAKLWTLGVGTFRKRNGAAKIALDNAGIRSRGAYCASDGFFPFSDSVELLGKAGIRAVIQPGGSLNDRKVTEAANAFGMCMLFTHERAFKH